MKKLKAVINIIKTLKIGLGEKDIVKIDKILIEFYKAKGVI